MDIQGLKQKQKTFFNTLITKDIAFRKASLKLLRTELLLRENDIAKALFKDFRKPEFESVMTEIGIVNTELDLAIRKLDSWARPQHVWPVLVNLPSCDMIYKEPYGNVLIIAPWNYPYQLVFSPLIGAIAAGNTVVIKPSELSSHTSKLIAEIIARIFDPGHVSVVEGDASVSTALLHERWDYIFFTGSITVGKIVAKAAAEYLTPVTLELGGKNPCIVDETADIAMAARRIVWGKFINCGQTCIAPDYVLVAESVKTTFVEYCKSEIIRVYSNDPKQSPDYCRIINDRNFDTLQQFILNERVLAGGVTDRAEKYIAPTLLDNPKLDSPVMKTEIFGPILPVIGYTSTEQMDAIIASYEKPLAFYIFSLRKAFVRRTLQKHAFGGGSINDTIVHFANHRLPFGGVGYSGMGAYHGKGSFDTFAHRKGVTKRFNFLDLPVRYAPYLNKLKTLKLLFRWLS